MKKILLVFLVIFLISCAKKIDPNLKEISIHTSDKNITLNVEIADDKNERAKGLMFREKMDQNNGMLFIFDQESQVAFWMKNTLIPLDMIFIGKDLEIVDIKNAVPCEADPCALYKPKSAAKYVLEVNYGFSKEKGISVGDKVNLDAAVH